MCGLSTSEGKARSAALACIQVCRTALGSGSHYVWEQVKSVVPFYIAGESEFVDLVLGLFKSLGIRDSCNNLAGGGGGGAMVLPFSRLVFAYE